MIRRKPFFDRKYEKDEEQYNAHRRLYCSLTLE